MSKQHFFISSLYILNIGLRSWYKPHLIQKHPYKAAVIIPRSQMGILKVTKFKNEVPSPSSHMWCHWDPKYLFLITQAHKVLLF